MPGMCLAWRGVKLYPLRGTHRIDDRGATGVCSAVLPETRYARSGDVSIAYQV